MDKKTLADYNVQEGSVVQLAMTQVKVFIKTLDDRKFPVSVDTCDTVDKFKTEIQAETGLKPEEQQILFGGKWLMEKKILTDYNVQEGSVFYLVEPVNVGKLFERFTDKKYLADYHIQEGSIAPRGIQ